jgi:hypothetical protein
MEEEENTKIYLWAPPRKWNIFGFVHWKLFIYILEAHG